MHHLYCIFRALSSFSYPKSQYTSTRAIWFIPPKLQLIVLQPLPRYIGKHKRKQKIANFETVAKNSNRTCNDKNDDDDDDDDDDGDDDKDDDDDDDGDDDKDDDDDDDGDDDKDDDDDDDGDDDNDEDDNDGDDENKQKKKKTIRR